MRISYDRAAYMTVSELAAKLGVTRNTLHYWISTGQVKARRAGMAKRSPFLIPREEAERVLREMADIIAADDQNV